MVNSGKELPQGTHADRFDENRVYSITSYSKGELFLTQLMYLIGKDNLMKTLKKYYSDFKFKHPTPNDIKRTAERVSGANLDWYLTDWTQTTNTIDYGIKEVTENAGQTKVVLERIGRMPMPIDLLVEYTDGTAWSSLKGASRVITTIFRTVKKPVFNNSAQVKTISIFDKNGNCYGADSGNSLNACILP